MRHSTPNWTWLKAAGAFVLFIPAVAAASFTRPLQDVPEHLGTGAFALDDQWSLFGLIGLGVVLGLLAGFYRRDK